MSVLREPTDVELLALTRVGNRDAYGRLVSRYQTLIASIAYGICGDFARSEDIAQEAFVAGWRGLSGLEDDTKFKSWLCGIARNLAHNFVRQQGRRADRPGDATAADSELLDDVPGPRERTVDREEAALVWEILEKLPESYREPLILFYREHQSIERVATALDLSEDTVKQRLSRGRALLRDEVEKRVERSLGFTTPGPMFATAVLGALAALGPQVVAGAVAVTTLKVGAAGKASVSFSSLPVVATLVAPVIALIDLLFARRLALRAADTAPRKRFIRRLYAGLAGLVVLTSIGPYPMVWRIHSGAADSPRFLLWLALWFAAVIAYIVVLFGWAMRPMIEWGRSYRLPANATPLQRRLWLGPDRSVSYRSRFTVLGLPLVHVQFGYSCDRPDLRGTARGWIAIGDVAYGVLFAAGGIAVGGIAIGVFSSGLLTIGVGALGGLAFGGIAVGGLACGVAAFGYLASGFIAVGYDSAIGLVAFARRMAEGGLFAMAEHVADAAAQAWVTTSLSYAVLVKSPLVFTLLSLICPPMSLIGSSWLLRRRVPRRPKECLAKDTKGMK